MRTRPFSSVLFFAALAFLAVTAAAQTQERNCSPTWTVYMTNSAKPLAREIASPCTRPEVMQAASAMGMARYDPPTIKDVITAQWVMQGTFLPFDSTTDAPVNVSRLTLGVSYVVPGLRLDYEGAQADGRTAKGIIVASGRYAWDETAPGIGAAAAKAGAIDRRLPLIWLTPFGALWAAIDGMPQELRVTTADGKTVIGSVIDGFQVTATLDGDHRPATVEVRGKEGTYSARYSGYRGDDYGVMTPTNVEWTFNGRPLASLTVTQFRGNPYVIFPVPAAIKTNSPK